MNNGKFEQVGAPREIYEHPQNKFVANFIGESNIFEASVVSETGTKGTLTLMMENGHVLAEGEGFKYEEIVYLCLRPENIEISATPREGFTLKGFVRDHVYVGNVVKTNATISGAAGGCQAEIGTACAMGCGLASYIEGLGSNQIDYAAEIGIERQGPPLAGETVEIAPDPDNDAVLVQQGIVLFAGYAAAAGGDHRPGLLAQVGKNPCLAFAKARFALVGKDYGNGHAGGFFQLLVRFEKGTAQLFREKPADRGLAAAGHTDQDNILHLPRKLPGNTRDLPVGEGVSEKDLRAALGLRHQHRQAARAGDAAFFRLQQKRGAGGIVYHIQHGLQLRKDAEIDEAGAVFRVHAHRRRVDQELCIPVPFKVRIVILTAAGDGDDLRPALSQHRADRDGRAAGRRRSTRPAV